MGRMELHTLTGESLAPGRTRRRDVYVLTGESMELGSREGDDALYGVMVVNW